MNNVQNLQFILPELVLLIVALFSLIGGAFDLKKGPIALLAFFGILVSGFLLFSLKTTGGTFFSGMLINDPISILFREIVLLIAGIVVLMSLGYKDLDTDFGEYFFFLLIVTISLMLAASSNNLMMIYITLEAISLVSYIMAGFLKRDIFSSEAGLKYFLFGAVSTGVTLYGVSLVYGLFGSLDLAVIGQTLAGAPFAEPALLLALALVIIGFCFKCSLVPFHMWTPDVYQGAPTPVAAFFSVGPKAIGFAFILRIFILNFFPALPLWPLLAGLVAIFTMTIGNISALKQTNIKRLLAYSTIAQAGFIFIGLTVGTVAGVQVTLFYIVIYSLMNLGAFCAVIAISNTIKSESIEDYAGLYKRDPVTAILLTVALLSLAGLPPLAGFMAKFFILASAIESGYTSLAIFAVLNSVIGLYYYLKIAKYMFLHEPRNSSLIEKSPVFVFSLFVLVLCNVVFGLWPQPIFAWIKHLGM